MVFFFLKKYNNLYNNYKVFKEIKKKNYLLYLFLI
jgi:hypothetical protein